MPLQNRVLPNGQIVANPARGTLMGNRGILHKPDRTLGTARWRHKAWISCVLAFGDRHSEVMPAHGYTRLFFLDEAVALAAGHRPCAECRRAEFRAFKACWPHPAPPAGVRAADIDKILHGERLQGRGRAQKTFSARLNDLPDGAFVRLADRSTCYLVLGPDLVPFTPAAYGAAIERPPVAAVEVLTPLSILGVLTAGYRPKLHASAKA